MIWRYGISSYHRSFVGSTTNRVPVSTCHTDTRIPRLTINKSIWCRTFEVLKPAVMNLKCIIWIVITLRMGFPSSSVRKPWPTCTAHQGLPRGNEQRQWLSKWNTASVWCMTESCKTLTLPLIKNKIANPSFWKIHTSASDEYIRLQSVLPKTVEAYTSWELLGSW